MMASCKDDCEALMSAVLPVAEQVLTEQRKLLPFGSTLSSADQIVQVGGAESADNVDSAQLFADFEASFRDGARRGELKATALVSAREAEEGAESAVLVQLDHRENYSIIVSFPYHFSATGELSIGEPFAVEGEHEIFEG